MGSLLSPQLSPERLRLREGGKKVVLPMRCIQTPQRDGMFRYTSTCPGFNCKALPISSEDTTVQTQDGGEEKLFSFIVIHPAMKVQRWLCRHIAGVGW